MKQTSVNLAGAAAHQKKRDLRVRMLTILRALAARQKHPKHAQIFMDMSSTLDLTGPIDYTRLPMNPTGFVVKHAAVERHGIKATALLCELQVVSMTMLYYWLYAAMQDPQDLRSCEHYLTWLEDYISVPYGYAVIQDQHFNMYLYPLKGTAEDKPHLPEWLTENSGETV